MGEKLVLRFLGVLETNEYTLKQSHGVSPFSVAMANTTLEGESACGYLLSKTVRSIDIVRSEKIGLLDLPHLLDNPTGLTTRRLDNAARYPQLHSPSSNEGILFLAGMKEKNREVCRVGSAILSE